MFRREQYAKSNVTRTIALDARETANVLLATLFNLSFSTAGSITEARYERQRAAMHVEPTFLATISGGVFYRM